MLLCMTVAMPKALHLLKNLLIDLFSSIQGTNRRLHPSNFHQKEAKSQDSRSAQRAESKRALYDSSGRSAVYAAERRGRTQGNPYRASYAAPRARTGWSNFWYQQQRYNTHGKIQTSQCTLFMLPWSARYGQLTQMHCKNLCQNRRRIGDEK